MTDQEKSVLAKLNIEAQDIGAKLDNLRAFVGSQPFFSIGMRQRHLLIDQEEAMSQYLHILCQRVDDLEE